MRLTAAAPASSPASVARRGGDGTVAALLRFFLPSRSATVQRRVWLLVVADGVAQVTLAVLRAAAMAGTSFTLAEKMNSRWIRSCRDGGSSREDLDLFRFMVVREGWWSGAHGGRKESFHGVVQIPARTGVLEMEVEDGCCRGCWCVAGEVRRCGGGCHGGERRGENWG